MAGWQQPRYDPRAHRDRLSRPPGDDGSQPPRPEFRPHPESGPRGRWYAPGEYPEPPPPPPARRPPVPPQRPRPAARPPQRKGGGGFGIFLGFVAVAIFLGAGIAVARSGGSQPGAAPPASPSVTSPVTSPATSGTTARTVTYEVTGSDADVTYGPAGSGYSGSVPMRVTRPLGASAAYYFISAQLQGGGTVSCEILAGGQVLSRAVASGGYQVAMCEIVRNPLTGQWQDTNT